jgi:CRISPR-associated protein Cas1
MIKRTIVIERPARLSFATDQLVISMDADDGNRQERTVPIEDMAVLVIETPQATLTNALLAELVSRQVAVVTCNDRHMPVGLLMPLEGNTLQSARFQMQMEVSLPLKKQVWSQLIKMKLVNQAQVLQRSGREADALLHWSKEVRSGDPENLEARGAAHYWPRLFDDVNFRRTRDGQPPNHLLNYGYAIVRAAVARALVASGLMPTYGVHHRNQYNAYCLADDVMEPYRPFVDDIVLSEGGRLGYPEELTRDWKGTLLQVLTTDVYIQQERSPLLVAVSKTSSSLVKVFEGSQKRVDLPTFTPYVVREDQRL